MTLSGGTHLIFNMKFNKQFNYNLYSNQSQSIRDAIIVVYIVTLGTQI